MPRPSAAEPAARRKTQSKASAQEDGWGRKAAPEEADDVVGVDVRQVLDLAVHLGHTPGRGASGKPKQQLITSGSVGRAALGAVQGASPGLGSRISGFGREQLPAARRAVAP